MKGLKALLTYDGDDVESVFGLNFVATYDAFGEKVSVSLVPDGENTAVTKQNRSGMAITFVCTV
jgi:E3 ubiquitin-protein ligase HECTD2